MDDLDLTAGFNDSPKPRRGSISRDRILQIARSDNIPDDIADDFAKVMSFESGGSHFDRRGKVKLSPPDPKTGERAVGAVQIKPSTARGVGVDDPFDEEKNLLAGLRYFKAGGTDPAGRRIHYFGGPGALKRYQRTGKIPKGKDVLGTTFEQYVKSTGGERKQKPKIDLSAGFEGNELASGLEDSGQIPPPSPEVENKQQRPPGRPINPAKRQSVPKTKSAPQLFDKAVPKVLDMLAPSKPITFQEDRAQRVREQKDMDVLKGRAGAATDFSGEEYQNFLRLNRSLHNDSPKMRDQFLTLKAKQAIEASGSGSPYGTLTAQNRESERQERVSKTSTAQKAAQIPKSLASGLASGVGSTLKGVAVAGRKLADQAIDTRGLNTEDTHFYRLGDYIQKSVPEILGSNPDLEQEFFVGKAPQAVGQSISFLLGGFATKAPKATVAILGGGMTAGSAYDEVKAAGGTDEEAVNAGLISGVVLGPTELLGMRGMMKAMAGTPAEATLKAALQKAFREGRRDVVENALQEVGQEYLQGRITGRQRSFDELLEAAALGGLASGVVTPATTLATQVGGRRGTQTEVQPPVEAQRETVEPASRGTEIQSQAGLPRDVEVSAPISGIHAEAPRESAPADEERQRFYHKDWGEVEVLEDQSGANKGKVKVAEVADPTKLHFPKRSDLRGRGNERMVPVKALDEIAENDPIALRSPDVKQIPNLEAGIVDDLKVSPPNQPPATAIQPSPAEAGSAVSMPEISATEQSIEQLAKPQVVNRAVKRAERTAYGQSTKASLAQFVRRSGGVTPTETHRGELDRLRVREMDGAGAFLVGSRKQGGVEQSADIMMQMANDAGREGTQSPPEQPTRQAEPEIKVPVRFALAKPIKGKTGAEIVGYHWRSREGERFSEREGGLVPARVSNWEDPGTSTGTGRQIVHEYFVRHPDGHVTIEGIGSAQKILGINETRLQTIARKEREAQRIRSQQIEGFAKSYETNAKASAAEASQSFRQRNYSHMRSAEQNEAIFDESVLLERDGQFIRIVGTNNVAMMKERGWSERAPSTSRPAEQLGFVQEGLTPQESQRGTSSTPLRDRLVREEEDRQSQLNPKRTAALAKLEEIKRRGMTVDDYARQPDLVGSVPSAEEVAALRELDSQTLENRKNVQSNELLNFGPGTMRAGEPLPEVKERKFGKRFTEDERIADEIRSEIGTAKYYEPIPNKITTAEATKLVDERGIGESIRIIRDEKNDLPAHIRSTMGQIVIQKLNETYKNLKAAGSDKAEFVLNQATDLAEWQMDYGTRLGQGVQSFAVWGLMTPEGKLVTYKRAVQKARDARSKHYSEDVAEIVKVVNQEMTDSERAEALKKLFKTNKTAKRVKTDFDKLLEAAKVGKLTDSLFYDIVGERLGLPSYNRETANKITDLAIRIEAAPEGLPRTKLILELQKFIAEQKGFDVADLPLGIFYGNILSGYNTHAVNFADTGLNVLSEINGLALNNPQAAAKIYAGMLRGFAEGRWDAMLALTEGRMFRDSKWLDAPGLMEVAKFGQKGGVPIKTETRIGRFAKRAAESKIAIPLNAYKYVSRAMSASDAVMARSASEARSTLLAYKMAKDEGLKGDALESRVREILALDRQADFMAQAQREGFTGKEAQFRANELREMARPKDLTADAAEFAGEATYNHKPHGTLGMVSESIAGLTDKVKPLKLFVPFTRIVANVTNRGLNWTPYGFKRATYGWGFGKFREELDVEQRRQALTRATLGTAGLVLLGVMQEAGLLAIHGNGPNDREKRRQLMNAGWRPYTLQIGDAYVSYLYSPVGLGLSILGNWKDSSRYHELEQKDAATKAAYSVVRMGSTIFSQSFLSGLTRLFDALSDDSYKSVSGIKRSLSGTVSGMTTPNLVRDIYRLFDNKAYQPNTLMEDLVRNTPFAVLAGLKPTLNAFGEPVKLQRQRFFDIESSDPAWKFVIEKGLRVPVPGRTIEMEKGRRITPEEYHDLLKTTGPKVKDWIIKNRVRLSKMKEQDAQDELSEAAARIRKFELVKMKMKVRKRAA